MFLEARSRNLDHLNKEITINSNIQCYDFRTRYRLVIPKSYHQNLVISDLLCTLYVVHKCTMQFIIVSFLAHHGM